MFNRRHILIATAALGVAPNALWAKTIKRFSQGEDGLALKGYDATAYVQTGAPADGTDATTVTWKGATWRFVSAAEADTLRASPESYAPQFGGYCTRAMSLKKEVPGDPEVWRLHNGKLYVFFAAKGGEIFDEGRDEMIIKAQAHWDSLSFTE